MLKKIISISLALLLIAVPAMAEMFAGTTAARNRTPVVANAGGTIEELYIQPGLAVKEGETIARLRTIPEFVRAYDPEALPECEFIRFGASQRTLSQFVEAGWSMIGEFPL